MHFFDIDWNEMIMRAHIWQRMSLPLRRRLVDSQPAEHAIEERPYVKALRAMSRHPIPDSADENTFLGYLREHFTIIERQALARPMNVYGLHDHGIAHAVMAEEWIRQALERGDHVAALLHAIIENGGIAAVGDLEDVPGAVVHAAVCKLLLFATLDEDLVPVLTVWPTTFARVVRGEPEPPEPVQPVETFSAPVLMDDAAAVLVAAFAAPLRMRADFSLYARAEQQIAASLTPVPPWVAEITELEVAHDRIINAVRFLTALGFVTTDGEPARSLTLQPTPAARVWLASDRATRLRSFADLIRPKAGKRAHNAEPVPALIEVPIWPADLIPLIEKHAIDVLCGIPVGHFVRIVDYLQYQACVDNPLAAEGPAGTGYIGHQSIRTMIAEEREAAWMEILAGVMMDHLVSMGGIVLGRFEEGRTAFSINEIGRYILGRTESLELAEPPAAGVVVQPNFEIVFLSTAPAAEAELAQFAERVGSGVGTLFRVTRASVFIAAAAGLTAAQVLETLRALATNEVPANVEREITGWFAAARHVSGAPAYIIRCPDEETAVRVLGVIGRAGHALTPLIVEVTDPSTIKDLARKLAKLGISATLASPPSGRKRR